MTTISALSPPSGVFEQKASGVGFTVSEPQKVKLIGRTLSHDRITAKLGKGGMG